MENNATTKEKCTVGSVDRNSSVFEILLDNESIGSSFGTFKYGETYSISVDGEYITSFDYKNNLTKTFKSNDHTVKIVFMDTNSTSIKQFNNANQGNFLDFSF